VKLFPTRNRGHGSTGLVALLESVAAEMRLRHADGERLQIGDLGAERGGRITRHGSHQNGLDADLAYFRVSHTEQDLADESGFAATYVDAQGRVKPDFDVARNWELVKLLRASGRLNRVFMDQAIKETLCAHARAVGEYTTETETLRRLRPLEGHADHLHVRLTCPSTSSECRAQEEPPAGSGCGATSRPLRDLILDQMPGFAAPDLEIGC
jgi:penicillin-insensitive murein endopeptidase